MRGVQGSHFGRQLRTGDDARKGAFVVGEADGEDSTRIANLCCRRGMHYLVQFVVCEIWRATKERRSSMRCKK